ncbi:MAG: PilZ domain-containing protein [Gammaproteobacteria bacterium]
MKAADERRDYYRINDTVGLRVEPTTQEQIPAMEDFTEQSADEFRLINHLSRIDLENSTLLHNIQDTNPDIARYLKLINIKIEAIAKQIVAMGLTDEVKPTDITLSAGGISFKGNIPFDKGDLVKLQMILYPSNAVINAYARAVRSQPQGDVFDNAFEYILITESDRDTLVRHVLQLQSNSLRQRSLNNQANGN